MNTKQFFRIWTVVLIALLCCSSPTWAATYNAENIKDDGGGTYNFSWEHDDAVGLLSSFMNYKMDQYQKLKTSKSFDAGSDQFYWEFNVNICPDLDDLGYKTFSADDEQAFAIYVATFTFNGEVLLVTSDGTAHQIATFDFSKATQANFVSQTEINVPCTMVDANYGQVAVKKTTARGINVYFSPVKKTYIHKDVEKIIIRSTVTARDGSNLYPNVGTLKYEKALDFSSIDEGKPMPKLTIDWNDKGEIGCQAADVKDKRGNSKYVAQFYRLTRYIYYQKTRMGIYKEYLFGTDRDNLTITDKSGGKMDLDFSFWPFNHKGLDRSDAAYTIPVYVKYCGVVRVNPSIPGAAKTYVSYDQPDVWVVVKPFTRPTSVKVEFDKWGKKNTVTWTRAENVQGWNGSKWTHDDCRFDGKWYVIRYKKGQLASDYQLIGSVSGKNKPEALKLTDDNIDYDEEYVYRVVFLPEVLEEKYSEKLADLPGQSETHYKTDLWEEGSVSTRMEIPVQLSQDRSDDSGIHLVWEYNVQTNGCEWRIDKHRLGESTWTKVTTIPVDTKQSTASYVETGGSVCDRYVYRIMTKINDKELYSDTLVCNLPAGAYISEVKASTGTEEKNVIVKWKVARPGDDDIWFRVLRRPIGSDEWTLLSDDIHGHATEYTFIDERVMAGSYYEYSIEAYGAKCEGQLVQTGSSVAPGFSQGRGTITGHISYGTGTAVNGVRVNLVKSSADESTDQPQFLSRYIDGEGKGLQWTADSAKYASVLTGEKELTLQLWARPMEDSEACTKALVVLNNVLELGVKSDNGTDYILYSNDLSYGGLKRYYPTLKFSKFDFTHVAATYKQGKWTFYVGTDTLYHESINAERNYWKVCKRAGTPSLLIGGDIKQNSYDNNKVYNGFVDDVRLWSRALTESELNANYTRILGGTENGLLLYWPLDEGINVTKYAFDVACQDGLYQLNHPEVGINATPNTAVPRLLGLYGMTDAEGDYIIRGIPFQQGGTNYKLVPDMGVHEFSPNMRSMFVSPTSLTANNIDFEDVSSFPMKGYVYYAGTNIPAEGIELYVDGTASLKDGQVSKTDANGFYEISVPIGQHYVEAKLGSHTMVAGGRYPLEGTANFDREVQYDFADSTLVNFVGRVGGGERNDTLSVGFGASKNNIGMATVALKLNNPSFSFNCQDDHISDAATERTWESDTTAINSRSWTGTGADSKYIYIRTDSLTGEFSALLPPLKYITKSIVVDKNPDIEFTKLPEVDLTNIVMNLQDSMTVYQENGDSITKFYTYNTKQIHTHFAKPQVKLWQPDNSVGAFGLKEYEGEDTFGPFKVSDLWTLEEDKLKYTYDYPILEQSDSVTWKLRGFEAYENRDGKTVVVDTIPLRGQVLTIANEMSSDQRVVALDSPPAGGLEPGEIYDLKKDQCQLDADGMFTYGWHVGLPSITKPYTRNINITFTRKNRTYMGPNLNAIVVGDLPSADNFVTKGPDKLLNVLRDPPGAKSKTTWKKGSVQTKISTSSDCAYGKYKLTVKHNYGQKVEIAAGGALKLVMSDLNNTFNTLGGFSIKWKTGTSKDQTWTLTATESVSTSSGGKFVGSAGDTFIGLSTNLLIGNTRVIGFIRESADAPFTMGEQDAMSVSDSVKTTFMYSTYELENVMLPKWKDTRNSLINVFVNSKPEAEAYVNNSDDVQYVTWLKATDEHFGEEDTYVMKVPNNSEWKNKIGAGDEVQWCNSQIESWEATLRFNEWEKVFAMQNSNELWQKNISFDGGTNYTYSHKSSYSKAIKHNVTYKLGGIFKAGETEEVEASTLAFKNVVSFSTEHGRDVSETTSDYDENTNDYAEFEYTFDDGNRGTDFSVDVFKSPYQFSDIFSLVGGQSYNPYEGEEKTKWFEEGQHVLSNGTQQMEQPGIKISLDGKDGGKSATLTDVPAGQTGTFTLHLTNNSTTHQGFDFTHNVLIQEDSNPNGLEILMDGVPANGRGVYIPAGETVKKVITVRQTDQSVLDYKNVEIRFASQYQPAKIKDAVKLNVSFKPASSPIDLVISEPVLNTENKDGSLSLKLTNFDRQFKNLKSVGVQYRFAGNTQWTTLHTYVTKAADLAGDGYSMLPEEGDIRLTEDMSNNMSYPEGNYEFRAFTATPYGEEMIYTYSEALPVVKDLTRPRALTTPAPTSGILRYGDDLLLELNEDIVPGYVSDKNIIVMARLNDQPIDHSVALQLYGQSFGETHTKNPVFLDGDFSVEFWVKWTEPGIILQQGYDSNKFSLSTDDNGHLVVAFAGYEYTSKDVLPRNEWTYIVLSYNSNDMTFTALGQYDKESKMLFKDQPTDQWANMTADYSADNYLYLGGGTFEGAIHDLSLFNVYRDVIDAGSMKYQSKNQYVYGLSNYWPMNEGHGAVAADTRHTHDMLVLPNWTLDGLNYALWLKQASTDGVTIDITKDNTGRGDSYAIELWAMDMNPQTEHDAVLFETGSVASNKLRLYYNKEHDVCLDYGEQTKVVASHTDFPADVAMHHFALNVLRGQTAAFYYDGQRTATIMESEMPRVEGTVLRLGQGFNGMMDEVRYWKATLTEERLLANQWNCIDTTDVYSRGLAVYLPFEKNGIVNGINTKVPTLENMLPHAKNALVCDEEKAAAWESQTMLKAAPEESRIIATPVASERKVVIHLDANVRDIEGTTLNVVVDKLHDLNGNESLPIRWQAYVQQNTLKWSKDSVTVSKKYGDEYTFDVNITNECGSTEYYTIFNMPQWLSLVDSEVTDDLEPLSQKTLRFKVDPMVAVGNYDVNIGLQGNNEIMEPLRIVMKVRGEMPDWTVDASKYEHSMNIIGQVYLNGVMMANGDSRVAAFIGNECRGIAAPEKVLGTAYVTLTVYGNGVRTADLNKPVTFRIWDASKGVVYSDVNISMSDAAPVSSVAFQVDQLIGDLEHPAIWTKGSKVEQILRLHEKWNWVALGVQPDNTNPAVVFPDLTSWKTIIKDRYTSVYSSGAEWRGPLFIDGGEMYKMHLTRLNSSRDISGGMPVKGSQLDPDTSPVTLRPGWNWIGYIPMTTMNIDEALAGTGAQIGDRIKSQTAFAIYSESGWEGSLTAMESGQGYMYYNNSDVTKQFVYPTPIATGNRAAAKVQSTMRTIQLSTFSPVDPYDYPDNMSMVIQLIDGAEVVDTAEVAAFVDGECRGASRADNGLYYLMVAGEGSGQPMELRTCIEGEMLTIDTRNVYTSDAIVGDPWEPYVINLQQLTGIRTVGIGSPDDSTWYDLQGRKLRQKPSRKGLYIENGKKRVINKK